MRKLILFPCIALLTAAAPAAAEPAQVANQIAASEAQQAVALSGGRDVQATATEKKICKQLDSTGSRLPRRACLTEREWKQLQAELEQ
jgi:hypothetical protein